MNAPTARFSVVYHVAAMNHWREVVREQILLLLQNENLQAARITVAAGSEAAAHEAIDFVDPLLQGGGREIECTYYPSPLKNGEHPAIELVDALAHQTDAAIVLYFHAKGVSYSPPHPVAEAWRQSCNRIVAEADRWAQFLADSPYDACGPLMVHDPNHGFDYFAGNFWMARANYLRALPPYLDFRRNPGSEYFARADRQRFLAEVAVNRTKQMRGYSFDGAVMSISEFWRHFGQDQGQPGGSR